MTTSRLTKIRQAIEECDRYIAKESPRSPDLRPPETAALLAWYIAHREELIAQEAREARPAPRSCFCGAPGREYPNPYPGFPNHVSVLCDYHAAN